MTATTMMTFSNTCTVQPNSIARACTHTHTHNPEYSCLQAQYAQIASLQRQVEALQFELSTRPQAKCLSTPPKSESNMEVRIYIHAYTHTHVELLHKVRNVLILLHTAHFASNKSFVSIRCRGLLTRHMHIHTHVRISHTSCFWCLQFDIAQDTTLACYTQK